MRISSLSAVSAAKRRFTDHTPDRRIRVEERRQFDRRSQTRKNSQQRAQHTSGHADPLNMNTSSLPSATFLAHILGQQNEQSAQKSTNLAAERAYDKIKNPHLRPLHSRNA